MKGECKFVKLMDSVDSIRQLIDENEMVLIYFGSENCNVCSAVKPKVEGILGKYSAITSGLVDVEKSSKAAAEFSVFTIPVILVFIEGKEIIREARYISMKDIEDKIERYYNLLFK